MPPLFVLDIPRLTILTQPSNPPEHEPPSTEAVLAMPSGRAGSSTVPEFPAPVLVADGRSMTGKTKAMDYQVLDTHGVDANSSKHSNEADKKSLQGGASDADVADEVETPIEALVISATHFPKMITNPD